MPSPPARTRSTRSRSGCRCGRKRCTREARSGSAGALELDQAFRQVQRSEMSEREQREWWGSSAEEQRNGDDEQYGFQQPSPVREQRSLRELLSRFWAVIAAVAGVLLKFGFAAFKF